VRMTKSLELVRLALALTLAVLVLFAFGCAEKEPTPTTVEPPPAGKPVEIVIYTDFVCGDCARLHFEVETELVRQYVNTGKAEFKIYLLTGLGPDSLRAAQAALCADEQGRFWEYRDTILAAFYQTGLAAYSDGELLKAADELGLDKGSFLACLNSAAILEKLAQNLRQSQAAGIDYVPTIIINGIKVVGAMPLETYVNIIEEQLTS
jgi:protein-disulfide isomerase